MEERRERGLKKLPDGRWQWSYKDPLGNYHRHKARTKGEARAYLEKVHTQIREGRYLDRRKEAKTKFEEAVRKFLEWSHTNLRRRPHEVDKWASASWLASPSFAGKTLDKITAGDIEAYKLSRLQEVDKRGPSQSGLLALAAHLYQGRTGRTLKGKKLREPVKLGLKALTPQHSGARLKEAVQWYFQRPGHLKLEKFTSDVETHLARPDSGAGRRTLAKRSVDISLARLKRMVNLCVEWGLCEKNPAAKVKLFRADNKRTRYLSQEEESRLIKACDPYLQRVVRFALLTGMRRGEILGLRWRDVDLRNCVAKIPAGLAKGKRDRFVYLSKDALSLLQELPRSIDSGALVFGNANGRREGSIGRRWTIAIAKAEIENFRFHDLRHTFASRLVMAGVDLAVLRELMGHTTFTMTLRYAHLAPSRLKEAVNILNEAAPKLHLSCNRGEAAGMVSKVDSTQVIDESTS